MTETADPSSQPSLTIPADDPNRTVTVSNPDGADMRHVFVAATLTTLVSGAQTSGRYCVIDALVPHGSGPVPHRHDFEESFILLDGELEFIVRGQTQTVRAGSTIHIPANGSAPLQNTSGKTVHVLFVCAPAGQEEFFMAVGVPVESRTSAPPKLSPDEQALKRQLAEALAPKYRTEIIKPDTVQS
jgi:quercetin dioxygenase-like cupin family protein